MITENEGKIIRAAGYWIQGDRMFLNNGADSIDVYRVKSVAEENPSEDALKEKGKLAQGMRRDIEGLLVREKPVMEAQSAGIAKVSGSNSDHPLDSKAKKAFLAGLEANRDSLGRLREDWKKVRLPDFSLLRMRDIKLLQFMSLEASIDQTAKFMKTGDPTYRESAKVQMGMAKSFDESFREALPSK